MAALSLSIVIVTRERNGYVFKVFRGLGAGALDAFNTPVLQAPAGDEGRELCF